MSTDSVSRKVQIVMEILPLLELLPAFALKGGAAINYFYRDLPRYSVDIDLTYLPLQDRRTTLTSISDALTSLKVTLEVPGLKFRAHPIAVAGQDAVTTLMIKSDSEEVIVEANSVLRGSVYPPAKQRLTPRARAEFKADFTAQILSMEDTYAGKLSAALSRQLPRDFFDVKILLENEGLTPKIMNAFVVYLSSDTRPFHELLSPNPIDISAAYNDNLLALKRDPVELETLLETRRKLIPAIKNTLTADQKEFLLSMASGTPKWELLDVPHAKELPGVKWKQLNLERMDRQKRKDQAKQLERILNS